MWSNLVSIPRTRMLPIGLHLTSHTVRAAQFRARGDRLEVHRLASAAIPLAEFPPTLDQDLNRSRHLQQFLAEHGFKGRKVVTCLNSCDLLIQNARHPAGGETDKQRVSWEFAERRPSQGDVEVRQFRAGTVRQDGRELQEFLLLECNRELLWRQVRVLEMAELTPLAIEIEPTAVLRSVLPRDPGFTRRMYIVFSENATTLAIADGRQIRFLRSITIGSQHFDEAVARHLVILPTIAAQTRLTAFSASQVDPHSEVHLAVLDAIRPHLDELCAEIETCARYFKRAFRGPPLREAVLAGAEATGWMAEVLSGRLGLSTVVGDPFSAWNIPAGAIEKPGQWAVSCGLALNQLDGRVRPGERRPTECETTS